jgi:hypothetical protein
MGPVQLVSLPLLVVASAVSAAWGAPSDRAPYVGYVYPAGGQAGTTVQVLVGGRGLGGVYGAFVSGAGVSAAVVEHVKPLGVMELQAVGMHIRALLEQRAAGRPEARRKLRERAPKAPATPEDKLPPLPDHPLTRGLDQKTVPELLALLERFQANKQQPRPQLAEGVTVRAILSADAAPGDRELRLLTPAGLSNPLCFQVGLRPEALEAEPLGRREPAGAPLAPPVLLNGQIMSGDADRYVLQCRQGQRLVVAVAARRLMPYIADAVPGWFQATAALYDPAGREVAYADDCRGDPDPVLLYPVPADGVYTLEIRDALYRGRDDFVYRVAVSEQPFVTSLFPLGGPVGVATTATVSGWNLPWQTVSLNTTPGPEPFRQTAWGAGETLSNPLSYAVGTLPEALEAGDRGDAAQAITLPVIVNGCLAAPGEVDRFTFQGRGGEEVVAEVQARRLGSPVDSLLHLTDAAGEVLAWNDDWDDRGVGLLTHQADSYLTCRLPADGSYTVRLSDTAQAGGPDYAYRLRLSAPRPDFALRLTPASVSIPAGGSAPVCVWALRRDGFAGEVELALRGAPPGFGLSGGRLPAGADCVHLTLSAPGQAGAGPVALQVEGTALIGGARVTHPAVPAWDMMQAFAYRHLVPAQELLVAVLGGRWGPRLGWAQPGAVRLAAGASVELAVSVSLPRVMRGAGAEVQFELGEAPRGVTLAETKPAPEGVTLVLKAAAEAAPGLSGNLIIEAYAQMAPRTQGTKRPRPGPRVPLGALPALPVEVLPRAGA